MEVGLWLWGVGVGVVCDNPCLILVFDVVTHKDVLGLRLLLVEWRAHTK